MIRSSHRRDGRIPLSNLTPDVPLDLPTAYQRAYDTGRHHRLVQYDRPLEPPLGSADTEWAGSMLAG